MCVYVCVEEMARPDWTQKAKHLADTCQAAQRERLLQQKHCGDFAEREVTLLFQTEKESRTLECLAVRSGHGGK